MTIQDFNEALQEQRLADSKRLSPDCSSRKSSEEYGPRTGPDSAGSPGWTQWY